MYPSGQTNWAQGGGVGRLGLMKRKRALTEVQVDPALKGPPPCLPMSASVPGFTVGLPQGASVLVPAGFDPEELLSLLVVVREALS